MKQCYYSEKLKKYFDTKDSCIAAEMKYDEAHKEEIRKKEERAAEAKKVEDLYKAANEAYKAANKAMNEFVEKYGSFHYSVTDSNLPTTSLFDTLFNKFWF